MTFVSMDGNMMSSPLVYGLPQAATQSGFTVENMFGDHVYRPAAPPPPHRPPFKSEHSCICKTWVNGADVIRSG